MASTNLETDSAIIEKQVENHSPESQQKMIAEYNERDI